VVGILISPIILAISKSVEDYGDTPLSKKLDGSFFDFMLEYFRLGFGCVLNFTSDPNFQDTLNGELVDVCMGTSIFLAFYVISLFLLQLTITTVSRTNPSLRSLIIH
jgi:hypothetical protein